MILIERKGKEIIRFLLNVQTDFHNHNIGKLADLCIKSQAQLIKQNQN